MKQYETVWEVFNQCPNNQMRDVFIDEVETDDPEVYVRRKFADRHITFQKTVCADGSIIFDIDASGVKERYSFTEIE